ncbi:leucine-rich repeat and IQ domain-containing protein 1 isoform X1 [Sigmodon hispidus]
MEDSDDSDAKLREEIEAELDKISISSLENDEVENDSESETQSDDSDTDLVELPESVLHCINIIKNKSKTAEELFLQDVEDTDEFRSSANSCNNSSVSTSHMHLKIGPAAELKENSEQLIKILSVIEKEEFMRSRTHSAMADSVPEPVNIDTAMDECILTDDADLSFGYFEVEENCRKTFEAWQDRQKELEEKDRETLEAQSDREKQKFQEDDAKRHCWIKQFEAEKEKLEIIQKQDQDKMNDELHKEEKIWKEKYREHEELIRNLHLQIEAERTRLNELQEKERARLLKRQHDAAVKIQAKYRAFVTYQKYSPIIREQIENKKRKAQEWKEKEAKIRQKEEERKRIIEEEQRIQEERKRKILEERRRREREYEEKKSILRQEREEQRNKEKMRLRQDAHPALIISCALKKSKGHAKQLAVTNISKNEGAVAEDFTNTISKKQDVCPAQQSNEREKVLTESIGVKLKPSQVILAELKMNENNGNFPKLKVNENIPKLKINEKGENLAKNQCSENLDIQEINFEHIDQKSELENSDRKENANTLCQGQGLKSQTQNKENVEHAKKNVGQETQIMFGYKENMSEEDSDGAQEMIRDNQERLAEKLQKTAQVGSLYENYSSPISLQEDVPLLMLENPEPVESSLMLEDKETDLNSKRTEEFPKDNVPSCNSNALVHTESKTNLQESVSCKQAPNEEAEEAAEASNHSANSPSVTEGDSSKFEMKAIPGQWKQAKAESDSVLACSVSQITLLSSVEERRLAWIKSFKPWSEIFEQNQLKKIIKKKRLVKCPPNTMPTLDTSAILQHGPWNTLQQVTAITFQDLPGCSLSTLAECTNLQLLSLRRCGLTSLHGLNNCKNLKYIDAQENHIETINCENLENLCAVLLNKNLLTSIHGLDGCTNIQNLELSHNKITRISGLESLKHLEQLTMDHNQLISTKGLCEAPTIIYLDCSHNHLTDVDGIGNCGLLQIVKLQGNYLREPPSLKNHVLLRELHLDDNSIISMEVLSSCWLPLLQDLSISQNSLTTIVPLFHFVSLEKLDVSNNCLSDLTSVMCWLDACYSLRELCLTGNPVLQEINWRQSVLKILPALRILNGDMLNPYSDVHTKEHYPEDLGCFLALCQCQLQEFNSLADKYMTQKGDILTLYSSDKLCDYYKAIMNLSIECRHAHEHGNVCIKRPEPEVKKIHTIFSNTNSTLQNKVFNSWTDKCKADSPNTSENLFDSGSRLAPLKWDEPEGRDQDKYMAPKDEHNGIYSPSTRKTSFGKMKMADSPMDNEQNTEHSETSKAAGLIQAQWRLYIARRQDNFSAKMNPTPTEPLPKPFTNNQTTSNKERRKDIMNIQEQREKAALHIQAVWKGFILRKKLATALEAIRNEESGEEYEEIDLEDFEYDEDALEKDWLVLDSTGFPSQTLPLSNQLPWPKKKSQTLKHDDTSLTVLAPPAQAWLCNEKENFFSSEHTQLRSRSENRTLSWTPESNTSRKSLLQSEKEEKISEEWGFKDISTAQQMLKRAQKMKSKKLRKKLDPSVRLALFKKNNNEISVTKSVRKTRRRRDSYFEGIEAQALCMIDEEENALSKPTTVDKELEKCKEYTYQWLHTQVGFPETTRSRTLKCDRFLPELDPDVLNGGRVQLVARLVSREDTDLDVVSMTSGSTLSVNREKKSQAHRYSSGSSSKLWFPSELI